MNDSFNILKESPILNSLARHRPVPPMSRKSSKPASEAQVNIDADDSTSMNSKLIWFKYFYSNKLNSHMNIKNHITSMNLLTRI